MKFQRLQLPAAIKVRGDSELYANAVFLHMKTTSRKAVSIPLQSQIQNFGCVNVYQGRVVVGNIDVHCDPLLFITTLEGHFEIVTLPNRIGAEVISGAVERQLHDVYEVRNSRD